ncbi:hypothetical protein EPUS_05907 [Endocarpon pusillum Z07020]|uniref:Amine oxidase domain-containing protein n=1 Tax=Endocarpon pusillum (strain Z07020 / HMAS-L-300199) TaxID=1263415 RepID=U1HTH6_ENDPU|nr:uncharacterized protein EPUS_05907 [Endocarpon pusillum Z07020]ERF73895.1 hypothetical protein EPUS_05907 [Endocarpon pusillum Z07020]
MDNRVASELSEAVWGIIAKALRYSDEHSAEIDKCQSLMDYFQDQVKEVTDDASMQALVLQQAQMWGGYVGDPIERQSLKFFFLEECIDGENAFVAGTYKKILAEIAATALADADIRLNDEVVFFHAHHDPQSTFPATVTLQTRSGTQHTYDEVVLTAPLGWLKRHKYDAFPPDSPLPSRLLQAIDNISYSRLEKVYVTFPMAFWQQDTSTAASHSEDSPNSNLSSSSASSAKSGPSTYPSFTHFSSPDYAPHPPDIPWNQVLVNLAALPDTTSHPTLLFYLYGACGTHLVNLIQDMPVSTSPSSPYHQTLRTFFEPFYSRLPNYDVHSASCTPSAFLATKWQLDPFAGNGAYTNIQVGLENGDKDIEVMREGVGEERRLWLAGEHTAPFIALGTTTGAYWSGEGVARRIVDLYDALEVGEAVVGEEADEEKMKKVPSVVEKRDAANANGLAL